MKYSFFFAVWLELPEPLSQVCGAAVESENNLEKLLKLFALLFSLLAAAFILVSGSHSELRIKNSFFFPVFLEFHEPLFLGYAGQQWHPEITWRNFKTFFAPFQPASCCIHHTSERKPLGT